MIRFLIPAALLLIVFVLARRYLDSASPAFRKSRKITLGIGAMSVILIIMTLLHRMHWVGPAAAIIAFIVRLIHQGTVEEAATSEQASSINSTNREQMSIDEATSILGLQKNYTQDEVIEAHRKLMQKMHPDRGGNDYLAAKINLAKDTLLQRNP